MFLFFGAMLAAIDLATVEFAQEHGHKPLAGLILGGDALGSAAGGLWYGSRTWHAPLRRRFAPTLGAAAGTATFWAMPGLAALAAVMVISGLALSPMLITGFSLIEQQAPPGRLTEGMAWLTSALAVGTAAGSAATGKVIDAGGARWGYALAAACAAGATLACLAGLTWLTVPAPPACTGPGRNRHPHQPAAAHLFRRGQHKPLARNSPGRERRMDRSERDHPRSQHDQQPRVFGGLERISGSRHRPDSGRP